MRRPGPLQELPLEPFLILNSNLALHDNVRPNKRPLSPPGTPSLYSPTKRRILNEEGVFSPDKTLKSPVSRSACHTSARFTEVLRGPQSPAKVLDFGTPKRSSGSTMKELTPTRPMTRSVTRLLASPELKTISHTPQNQRNEDEDMYDYFSSGPSVLRSPIKSETPTRRSLALIDPKSIHYPGFRVYRDGKSLPSTPDDSLSSIFGDDNDQESFKENVAPRRKPGKVTSPHLDVGARPAVPDGKEKLGRTKSTLKKIFETDKTQCGSSPTPRQPPRLPSEVAVTHKPGSKGRRAVEKLGRALPRGLSLVA